MYFTYFDYEDDRRESVLFGWMVDRMVWASAAVCSLTSSLLPGVRNDSGLW